MASLQLVKRSGILLKQWEVMCWEVYEVRYQRNLESFSGIYFSLVPARGGDVALTSSSLRFLCHLGKPGDSTASKIPQAV